MIALSGHVCTADCKAYANNDHPIPGRWQIGDWKFQRCPILLMDQRVFWYIKAYLFMEKGALPNAGGWLNQPNKLLEALAFITDEIKKREKDG